MIGAMILGALAASKNPQVANALMTGGQAVAAQSQLNFSRDMEREADRVGYGVMTGAGFDPRGMATMFEKLQQASRLNDSGGFPYLRSHPLTTERLGDAQARFQLNTPAADKPAADKSPAHANDTRVVHAMMAARARMLAEPGVDVLRSAVGDAQRAGNTPNEKTAAALYGGALAAAKLRDFKLASSLAAQLGNVVGKSVAAGAAAASGGSVRLGKNLVIPLGEGLRHDIAVEQPFGNDLECILWLLGQ